MYTDRCARHAACATHRVDPNPPRHGNQPTNQRPNQPIKQAEIDRSPTQLAQPSRNYKNTDVVHENSAINHNSTKRYLVSINHVFVFGKPARCAVGLAPLAPPRRSPPAVAPTPSSPRPHTPCEYHACTPSKAQRDDTKLHGLDRIWYHSSVHQLHLCPRQQAGREMNASDAGHSCNEAQSSQRAYCTD